MFASEQNIPKESSIDWRCRYTMDLTSFSKVFEERPYNCVIFTPDWFTLHNDSLFDSNKLVWIYFLKKCANDLILIAKRNDGIFVHFKATFDAEFVPNEVILNSSFEDFWKKHFLASRRISYSCSWEKFWNTCLDVESRKRLTII